jgi:hypothetical protein
MFWIVAVVVAVVVIAVATMRARRSTSMKEPAPKLDPRNAAQVRRQRDQVDRILMKRRGGSNRP